MEMRGKMAHARTVAKVMAALVREGFAHEFGKPQVEIREAPVWKRIRNAGSKLWLDTGDIEEALSLGLRQTPVLFFNGRPLLGIPRPWILSEVMEYAHTNFLHRNVPPEP